MYKRKRSFKGGKAKRPRTGSYLASAKARPDRRVFQRSPWGKFGDASKVIVRSPSVIPDRMFVKFRYSQVFIATSTTGGVVAQQMSGNSIYDPDVTGTGGVCGQAGVILGSSSSTGLYRNYKVFASRIRVRLNGYGVSTPGVQVVVFPAPISVVPSTSQNINKEIPYAKNIIAQSSETKWMTSFMTTERIEGRAPGTVDYDNSYSAGYGTSPVNQWYWNIAFSSADQANTATGAYNVEMTYYAEIYLRTRNGLT